MVEELFEMSRLGAGTFQRFTKSQEESSLLRY
jgi:hypothetical protein